jgi:hypothetical protein
MTTNEYTRKRTEQQGPKNVKIHVADKPVAESGYECERPRVGKIGAGNASCRKSWMENKRTATPGAPAPTEQNETRVPIKAPSAIVIDPEWRVRA